MSSGLLPDWRFHYSLRQLGHVALLPWHGVLSLFQVHLGLLGRCDIVLAAIGRVGDVLVGP